MEPLRRVRRHLLARLAPQGGPREGTWSVAASETPSPNLTQMAQIEPLTNSEIRSTTPF